MSTNAFREDLLVRELEALLQGGSIEDVCGLAANAMAALGEADQVVLWANDFWGTAKVKGIAGLSTVQRHNDFTNWFESAAPYAATHGTGPIVALDVAFSNEAIESDRHLYLLQHTLHLRLDSPEQAAFGGVFVMRSTPSSDRQLQVMVRYAKAVSTVLWQLRQQTLMRRLVGGKNPGWRWAMLFFGCALGSLFIPVRFSATASVEVSPRDAMPITAPQDGVIEKLLVRPNEAVTEGTSLVRYHESIDKSRLAIAEQNLAVARAEFDRTINKSFQDPGSRAEISTFRAKVREREAEAKLVRQMLDRLVIRAPQDGLATFADADDWVGRPVQKGERIMLLSDPQKVWLTLFVSPDEAIPEMEDAPVKVNLDIKPLQSLQALVVESSYESIVTPEGRVGYLMRAQLLPGQNPPRIGLKGVATVYGESTFLGYYLFRKPIRSLRRFFGL